MEAEYEMKVHYCEPQQGSMLGEEEDVDERSNESLMDYWENSDQYKKMTKTSTTTREPYIIKTNIWSMVVGCTSNEERKSLEIVIHIEEDERRNNEERCIMRMKLYFIHSKRL